MGPLSFEPVEFAKLGFILVLASVLDRPEIDLASMKVVAAAFALAGGHMLLIMREPYLGGTLVYVPIVLGMLFFAGVRPLYLLAIMFYGTGRDRDSHHLDLFLRPTAIAGTASDTEFLHGECEGRTAGDRTSVFSHGDYFFSVVGSPPASNPDYLAVCSVSVVDCGVRSVFGAFGTAFHQGLSTETHRRISQSRLRSVGRRVQHPPIRNCHWQRRIFRKGAFFGIPDPTGVPAGEAYDFIFS